MTSLNELLEIPGNRFVFEQLKQHLGTRRAVCFVGAGASAGLYPMWGAFIELLADIAFAEGKAMHAASGMKQRSFPPSSP